MKLVPSESAFQAFFEHHGGLVTEQLAGLGYIGLRIADVALAGGLVPGFETLAGDATELLQGLIQGDTTAGPDVDDFPRSAGGFACEQVGLDGVIDVGKVAALLAVAKNDGLSFLEESGSKF